MTQVANCRSARAWVVATRFYYTYCTPLERRDWSYRRSIDISLLWSESKLLDNP